VGTRSPLLPVLVFTLFCAGATWFALVAASIPYHWAYGAMLGWFAVITTALHMWQEHALATDIKRFMRRFLAGLVLKLLASMVAVMILLFSLTSGHKTVVITFVLLYLAYLGFSTARSVMLLKRGQP
jgi:hypothetical protein